MTPGGLVDQGATNQPSGVRSSATLTKEPFRVVSPHHGNFFNFFILLCVISTPILEVILTFLYQQSSNCLMTLGASGIWTTLPPKEKLPHRSYTSLRQKDEPFLNRIKAELPHDRTTILFVASRSSVGPREGAIFGGLLLAFPHIQGQ